MANNNCLVVKGRGQDHPIVNYTLATQGAPLVTNWYVVHAFIIPTHKG